LTLNRPNLLATPRGRRGLFAALYLTEGAPIGFVWWALPTLLAGRGWPIDRITLLTSVATLPWILKFLLAPTIDASLNRGVPAKRWILVCQFGMTFALLPLAWIDWGARPDWVLAAILAHAVFAAVQDVSIDTLAIRSVPAEELGRINGWMQTGMLVGRAGVAALATALAATLDRPGAAVLVLAALILVPGVVALGAFTEPRRERSGAVSLPPLKSILNRKVVLGASIALTVAAGFEFFGVSAGPRLVTLGTSETRISLFYGLIAPGGLALGALAGGALSDRIGALRATLVGLAAVTSVLLVLAFAAATPAVSRAIEGIGAFAVVYLAIGVLTASSYALLMGLARGPYAATEFSLFMAMTNACEAWAGFVGGRIAAVDYSLAVLALSVAACVALVPLFILKHSSLVSDPI